MAETVVVAPSAQQGDGGVGAGLGKFMPFVLVGCGLLYFLTRTKGDFTHNRKVDKVELPPMPKSDYSPLKDGSPSFFRSKTNSYDPKELLEISDAISKKFDNRVEAIANRMNASKKNILDRLGIVLSQSMKSGDSISEKGVSMYMSMLDSWTKVLVQLNVAAFSEFGKMAGYSDDIKKCTLFNYVDDPKFETYNHDEAWGSNTIRTNHTGIVMGIIGNSETTTQNYSGGWKTDRNKVTTHHYIQHCENWELDPVLLNVALSKRTLAYKEIMANIQLWFDQAPDPAKFVISAKHEEK